MKKLIIILLIFFSIFTLPLFAATEYVVGVGDYDYWPHHGVNDNKYQGYARELLDLFSKKTGHIFVYRPLPWKRVIHEYIRGEIDFIYPDNSAWDVEAKKGKAVHYSNAVVTYVDGVVVLPENKGNGIRRFKTIGTIRGFDVWEGTNYIQTGQVKVAESNDFGPLLKQVLMENVDGAYIELAVANYYLREVLNKPGALVFDPDLPFREDSYYLSTIKHPEIMKIFNKFQVTERNAIEALQKKYKVGDFAK